MDQQTADRLTAAVLGFEQAVRSIPPTAPPPITGEQPLQWMVLQSALPTAGTSSAYSTTVTVPAKTTAYMAKWLAAANSGSGGYYVDDSVAYTILASTQFMAVANGSWVLCRPLGNIEDGTVWEPVCAVFGLCFGLTTGGAVGSGSSTFTVNNITSADSSGAPTTTSSDSMTINNWCGWSCVATSGVKVMFSVISITGSPGGGTNIGSGNFVQGPCGS
jgi:hypothetical protein